MKWFILLHITCILSNCEISKNPCIFQLYGGRNTTFKVNFNSLSEFVYLHMNSSKARMTVYDSWGRTWTDRRSVGVRSRYVMLHAEMCTNSSLKACEVKVLLEADTKLVAMVTSDPRPMLQHNQVLDQSVQVYDRQQFGVFSQRKDLPTLISVVPDPSDPGCDVDVFVYTASRPDSAFFPQVNDRNKVKNSREGLVIRESFEETDFTKGAFFLVEVYGSPDSAAMLGNLEYRIGLRNRYMYESYGFHHELVLATSVALTVFFIVCTVFTCLYNQQWNWLLTMRGRPPILGATSAEINALEMEIFNPETSQIRREDRNCIICITDYEDSDRIRSLKCGHYFHKDCIDIWLKKKKICPLCNQPIHEARNLFAEEAVELECE